MSFKIKINLLVDILNPQEPDKYSKSILNLKTIFALEQEDKFVFPKSIIERFSKILEKEKNFKNGIHLLIIEQYYYKKREKLQGYISINLDNVRKLNMPVAELYIELENFYQEMFLLASIIANLYNIEIKINNRQKDDQFI
jgi:hypothetical protein